MKERITHHRVRDILTRSIRGGTLSQEDILCLLSNEEPRCIREIMATARRVREHHFANRIFLYGFIYISTYCRNLCTFCFYRKSNQISPRYRKSIDDVIEIAALLADSGVHLVDLTMGEDPRMHDNGDFAVLFAMIRWIKLQTGLPVMVSPGVVSNDILDTMAKLGVDWYALYQESHNRGLFHRLRPEQGFDERHNQRLAAKKSGLLIEDGFLLGVGETLMDRADAISAMRHEDADQVRVMSLIPQRQTPLAGRPTPPRRLEALCIAVMRLAMPERLIPASLDVDGINGLSLRLAAGANVVTSIIPPKRGLAGVSQSVLDIDQGLRSVRAVRDILAKMGLRSANTVEFASWMKDRHKAQRIVEDIKDETAYRGGPTPGVRSRLPGAVSWVRDRPHG